MDILYDLNVFLWMTVIFNEIQQYLILPLLTLPKFLHFHVLREFSE